MKEIIRAGLAELGLLDQVPPEAPEQLAEYGRLMLEKNQVMNLTAITDPEQAARLHMLDSAALLLCADFQGEKTLIDVGTGAGLPGLPLKILVPPSRSPCWTAWASGWNWLNQVCAQLGLEGIQAIHARAEEQALVKGYRDSFDFVTARAVAQLRLLGELCLPYVKVGGQFLGHEDHRVQLRAGGGRPLHQAAGGPGRGTGGLYHPRHPGHPPGPPHPEAGPHPEGLPPPVGPGFKSSPCDPQSVTFAHCAEAFPGFF